MGVGDGSGVGVGVGGGSGVAVGVGISEGVGFGVSVGAGLGLGVGVGAAVGETAGSADTVGTGVALTDAAAEFCRSLRISHSRQAASARISARQPAPIRTSSFVVRSFTYASPQNTFLEAS